MGDDESPILFIVMVQPESVSMVFQYSDMIKSKIVCKFGPGGAYERFWPEQTVGQIRYGTAGFCGLLGAALAWCAESIRRVLGRARLYGEESQQANYRAVREAGVQLGITRIEPTKSRQGYRSAQLLEEGRGKFPTSKQPEIPCESDFCDPDAIKGPDNTSYPQVQRQQWLFPGFEGIETSAPSRSNPVTRAPRKVRAKRTLTMAGTQNTLFDD